MTATREHTITYIEDDRDLGTARGELEDALNEAITALIQARHHHNQLAPDEASIFTDKAAAHLVTVKQLEALLVDYQLVQAGAA